MPRLIILYRVLFLSSQLIVSIHTVFMSNKTQCSIFWRCWLQVFCNLIIHTSKKSLFQEIFLPSTVTAISSSFVFFCSHCHCTKVDSSTDHPGTPGFTLQLSSWLKCTVLCAVSWGKWHSTVVSLSFTHHLLHHTTVCVYFVASVCVIEMSSVYALFDVILTKLVCVIADVVEECIIMFAHVW